MRKRGLPIVQIGDTFKQTWISSGTTATIISAAILSGSETIISSGSGVSSGNGHYYRLTSINSPGYFVSEWRALISGNNQVRRLRFKAVLNEVD